MTKLKKESKVKVTRIETLTQELAQARKEQKETSEELHRVSEQRDRLVEKVERLHAEKHQVEARLVVCCLLLLLLFPVFPT